MLDLNDDFVDFLSRAVNSDSDKDILYNLDFPADDGLSSIAASIDRQTADQVRELHAISASLQKRIEVAEKQLSVHQDEIEKNEALAKAASLRSWISIGISVLAILLQLISVLITTGSK